MGFSLFLFIEWLNHELDMFVITNNRIIGVEQISFLNRNVSECNLGQVQDVSSLTKWFFANILNYGTVTMQTAGNASNFLMDFCPKPLDNGRGILNIVDNYRDKYGGSKSLDGLKAQPAKQEVHH
jgi:Bacterial PH domain